MGRPCDKCGETDGRTWHIEILENGKPCGAWYLCTACRAETLVTLGAMPRPRRFP